MLDRVVASLDADAARDAAWDAVAARRDDAAQQDPTLMVSMDDALTRLMPAWPDADAAFTAVTSLDYMCWSFDTKVAIPNLVLDGNDIGSAQSRVYGRPDPAP